MTTRESQSPLWLAKHYPKVLKAYWTEGEDGLAEIEEELRAKAANRPGGKFSKSEAAYVPFVPLPPFDWRHECGHCRFWVDHGPDKPGECMIVGRKGDRWGGKAIHEKAGCALFTPPAGEPAFDWISEQVDPTGADLVRGEYHEPRRHDGDAAETAVTPRDGGRDQVRLRRHATERTVGESRIPAGTTVGLEPVATGLSAPIELEADPGSDGRRFIADQSGQVYLHDEDGVRDRPVLDLTDRMVELEPQYDERGLLGLALHPEFDDGGRFYVRYSAPPREGTPPDYSHTAVLAEFEMTDGRSTVDPDSGRTLLEIPQPQFNHNAGAIEFGPDGYLYVATGDGGSEGDTGTGHVAGGNGQDVTENLLGGILRIDVDGEARRASENASGQSPRANDTADRRGTEDAKPYAVPDDNPLVGEDGLDEYYAWGLRNPWRMSFDVRESSSDSRANQSAASSGDGDGRLFVADVGQHLYEEVDVVEKGGNYGWNVREGFHCFDPEDPTSPPDSCPDESERGEPLLDPIVEYPHVRGDEVVGSAVVGGAVYEGDAIPGLDGKYVFGDWATSQDKPSGRLFAATPPDGEGTSPTRGPREDGDGQWSMEELVVAGSENGRPNRHVLGFGQEDGRLYVLTSGTHVPKGETGAVHELVPSDSDHR